MCFKGSDPAGRSLRTAQTNTFQLQSTRDRNHGPGISGISVDVSQVRFTDVEKQEDHTQPYSYSSDDAVSGYRRSSPGSLASDKEGEEQFVAIVDAPKEHPFYTHKGV